MIGEDVVWSLQPLHHDPVLPALRNLEVVVRHFLFGRPQLAVSLGVRHRAGHAEIVLFQVPAVFCEPGRIWVPCFLSIS